MQMSLMISMHFFLAMIEMACHVHHVFSLELRPLIFMYLYTRAQSIQKQIVQYNIKVNILKNT